MRVLLLASLITLALFGAAWAQPWIMSPAGHVPPWGAGGGAAPTNLLLLVDGTSRLLQTDAASRICLAGGC